MKVGDLIGVGSGREVSLYCKVCAVLPDGSVGAMVINGAWHATILPAGKVEVRRYAESPLMHTTDGRILFTGRIPKGYDGYNSAIRYMNDYLQRNAMARACVDFKLWINDLTVRGRALKVRFTRSCAAFKRSWDGKPTAINHQEFDDMIPF